MAVSLWFGVCRKWREYMHLEMYILSLTRHTLNRIIDTEQGHSSLEGRLQAAHFADGGLQDPLGHIVSYFSVQKVQTISEKRLLRITSGSIESSVVIRT